MKSSMVQLIGLVIAVIPACTKGDAATAYDAAGVEDAGDSSAIDADVDSFGDVATHDDGVLDAPDGGDAGDASDGDAIAASDLPRCDDALFVDAIAESKWVDLHVPAGSVRAIRDAIVTARDAHASEPVRIRLGPGTYKDDLGGEIYAQRVLRTATTPIWIVADDPAPNHTRLMQGFNFVGVAYVAIDGVTIGPETVGAWDGTKHADPQPLSAQAGVHVAGAALDGAKSAKKADGSLDASVYGRYEPSHHLIVRHTTIQNVFSPDDPSGELPVGQDHDGMKFNQVEYLWVLSNSVTQTSRHGIDDVGVHHAAFCDNVIGRTGAGFGLEAKGGSFDVLFEGNTFYHVRRVALGGESTDATYYYSADGRYDYEARRLVARNNVVIDPREAAFDFSGCTECKLLSNTVIFTSGYKTPLTDTGDANGGDALRLHPSVLLSAAEGAGNDCVTWDDARKDYVSVDPCWGVGSNAPAPVGRALESNRCSMTDNLFVSANGIWSKSFGGGSSPSTIPCPINTSATLSADVLIGDYDYWWNGASALPAAGCTALPEGSHSQADAATAAKDPFLYGYTIDGTSNATIEATARAKLVPIAKSGLLGLGLPSPPDSVAYDHVRRAHPAAWTIGAFEGP